jgi:CHAT domain-containing protein
LFRSAGDFNGEATTVLAQGQLQQDTGDLAARATIEQALSMFRSRSDRLGELTALNALGRLALARDPATALDVTREAFDLAERLRALVVTPDLRATYLGAIQSVYDNRIDATMLAWEQRGRTDRALLESAVEIAEHGRARVMFESLSDLRGASVRGADATLTQRERDLTATIRALGVKRAAVPAGSSPGDLDRELEHAFGEYAVLQGEMRRQSADYAAVMHPTLPSLQTLRETLDDDTAVIEYALGEQHSWAWVISRSDVQAFPLPKRSAIETLGRQWHESLQKGTGTSKAADELSRMLIEPLAAQLTRQRLAIVPSGVLHYLPFAAMTKPNGAEGPGRQTLNVDHELVMLLSLSTLARQRETQQGRSGGPKTIAVFADPVFQPFDGRVTGGTARRTSPTASPATTGSPTAPITRAAEDSGLDITLLTRLEHAAEEAKAVTARVRDGQALVATGFQATRELATSPAMKDYRILHFITHAFVDSSHPNLSGLVLSMVDRDGRRIDGLLRLLDIYAMDLSADLVVLSACETALGRNIRGEGMMGLTRGFMHAGARRVVSTLWKVDDGDTAAFMARFYDKMLGDELLRPAAALRATQRSFAADPHWAATRLWAAFVLTGDWQ